MLKNEFLYMYEFIDFIVNMMFFNVMFKDSVVKILFILFFGLLGIGKF